ncbi:unnamed protein product [Rodentolepis nana]|uniref:Uncharacterized protein n=1 Tax=Rodentolepis nana TaxID=102285 RepID=A0A3P7T6B2_RODNA|nr:unnamed protein product [Rodentolepis nana]
MAYVLLLYTLLCEVMQGCSTHLSRVRQNCGYQRNKLLEDVTNLTQWSLPFRTKHPK